MRYSSRILGALVFCLQLKAQTYTFRSFSLKEGLQQNFIYSISQSSHGFLYMSTGEALVRFDGKNFEQVSGSKKTDDMITTHYVDHAEVVWAGHDRNGITYYDSHGAHPLNDSRLLGNRVNALLGTENDEIIAGTTNGLFFISHKNGVKPFGKTNFEVYSLCDGPSPLKLAGTADGVYALDPKTMQVQKIRAMNNMPVKQIVQSPNRHDFWVLDNNGFIYGLRYGEQGFRHFKTIKRFAGSENEITCIYCDNRGDLWISLLSEGLRKISQPETSSDSQTPLSTISKANGLQSDNIRSMIQDKEGNFWFGTFGDGLIQKKSDEFTFYGIAENVLHSDVKKIVAGDSGTLWLGDLNGIANYNPLTRSYTYFSSEQKFNDETVTALFRDSNSVVWIGTTASIYTLSGFGEQISSYSAQRKLGPVCVNAFTSYQGKVVAATTDGMIIFSGNNPVEHLRTNEGLLHNNIQSVFTDSRGRLWVSSHGAPPYYIHNRKVHAFKDLSGKKSFQINCVTEDLKHNIWIATDGEGVFKYDDTLFTSYTTQEGLLSDYCNGVEIDQSGNIWVTHSSGLSRKASNKRHFTVFTFNTGLLLAENNRNAVYNAGTNGIWFGTSSGLARHDPFGIYNVESRPEIYIQKVRFNGEEERITNNEVDKEPGDYSVYIAFRAVSLSNPDAIVYKWRITEADTNWKSTVMGYIDIPKLGDGSYSFEVFAIDQKTGLRSARPARLHFVIQKPYWKRAGFFILMFVLSITAVFVFIQIRTKHLKETRKLLELKVKQKTLLLQREKEAVEQVKGQLEVRNRDFTDSIVYAKRIQDSLLPSQETISELFGSDYFVLHKPKAIVSGDFYWVAPLNVNTNKREPLALAAVIDCTGHGVPGAFLSVMANALLKQSIIEEDVNTTQDILEYLNSEVSTHLNQKGTKDSVKDGMDIAVIGITPDRKRLYFSGANNGIYIVRGLNEDKQIFELKPTKRSIGHGLENVRRFQEHQFDIQPMDCIYLFSDGFADQFGGEDNKKLNHKRLRDVLKSVFDLPMNMQHKHLEKFFEEWRGSEDQTDDVCVFGIRV